MDLFEPRLISLPVKKLRVDDEKRRSEEEKRTMIKENAPIHGRRRRKQVRRQHRKNTATNTLTPTIAQQQFADTRISDIKSMIIECAAADCNDTPLEKKRSGLKQYWEEMIKVLLHLAQAERSLVAAKHAATEALKCLPDPES